mmetsp:Transcript_31696/g.80639  ORF Transcript_31696/g.80639 Transcript_31696/m.80639 type:complete len:142 (-) Transcript_31696:305-730(-)
MEQMGAGLGDIANVMAAHGQQTARFLEKQNYLRAGEMQMQQKQHMDTMSVRREEMMSAKETAKALLDFEREEAAKKMKLEEMKVCAHSLVPQHRLPVRTLAVARTPARARAPPHTRARTCSSTSKRRTRCSPSARRPWPAA